MASFKIQVGALSFERTTPDANAVSVLQKFSRGHGYGESLSDNQAVLDFAGQKLLDYLLASANSHKGDEARGAISRETWNA